MEKEIQTHAKKTVIPEDMWEAVGALRGALGDNPCVILDEADPEDGDRHYFFSDPELYQAILDVLEQLPHKQEIQRLKSALNLAHKDRLADAALHQPRKHALKMCRETLNCLYHYYSLTESAYDLINKTLVATDDAILSANADVDLPPKKGGDSTSDVTGG